MYILVVIDMQVTVTRYYFVQTFREISHHHSTEYRINFGYWLE